MSKQDSDAKHRESELIEEFRSPAAEYGPLPLWWWDGDDLDEERLTEQLEQLQEGGVPSVCFIQLYPTGPSGDEELYFSEEWWERMEHVATECDRLGMELWIHDETYHLSPPSLRAYWQEYIRSEMTERPELQGAVLTRTSQEVTDSQSITLSLPSEMEVLTAAAYPRDEEGVLHLDQAVELDPSNGELYWEGSEGDWHVAAIGTRPADLCYTNPSTVERFIDIHFEEYRRRLGDRVGTVLTGSIEEELHILDFEVPFDEDVLDRFESEHGSDPRPQLIGLYENIGHDTERLRAQYYDVVTSLVEDNWFKPLYEWHERHGMKRAHDNWGRNNLAVGTEMYGDFYRAIRWFQAPGYDDGWPTAIGDRNFFDAKLAASIAACYDRDRVRGELFHSAGWALPPDTQFAGIVENYCYGANLYDHALLYYTTLGGWFDHAPADVHFRQPYWEDVEGLNDAATRLSYLFSQGHPVVDVAMLYPSTSLHADWRPDEGIGETGNRIDGLTRELTERVYMAGSDLILADHESLIDADVSDGRLTIEEMDIPILLLGPLTTIRSDTLRAMRRFFDAGGLVLSVGSLPTAVVGATDGDGGDFLENTLKYIFGERFHAAQTGDMVGQAVNEHPDGGRGVLADVNADLGGLISEFIECDVHKSEPGVFHTHRRIGDTDAHLLFNSYDTERTATISLRSNGRPEKWDPIKGEIEPIHTYERNDGYLTVDLQFAPHGSHVIVLRENSTDRGPHVVDTSLASVESIEETSRGISVTGRIRSSGSHSVRVARSGTVLSGRLTDTSAPETIEVDDEWTFFLEPTMDNRWGDFRYPPEDRSIGAEVRSIKYRAERPGEDGLRQGWYREVVEIDRRESSDPHNDLFVGQSNRENGDGVRWESVDRTYGPFFWRQTGLEDEPESLPPVDSTSWEPYEFSQKFGKPGTHPYMLGYQSIVSDYYLVSPEGDGDTYFWTTVHSHDSRTVACHFGPGVEEFRLGGRRIETERFTHEPRIRDRTPSEDSAIAHLPAGKTELVIRVEPGVETYFAIESPDGEAIDRSMRYEPRLRWFQEDDLAFDYTPWIVEPVGWYRFEVPVGTSAFDLPITGEFDVWVDGEEFPVDEGSVTFDESRGTPATVAIRVEHERGAYGGAAFDRSPQIETEAVAVETTDWRNLGLESYSGRAHYRNTVVLPSLDSNDRVVLELGEVGVSASVEINGTPVGSAFRRPFCVDITDAANSGENQIDVTVANTLANHFDAETPMRYVETTVDRFDDTSRLLPTVDPENYVSGLLGPVTVRIEPAITIEGIN